MIEGGQVAIGWAKTWNQQVMSLQKHLLSLHIRTCGALEAGERGGSWD